MKLLKINMLLLLLLFCSCSTSFESTSIDVLLSISSNNLIINNQTPEEIFYFVVESEIVAVINWAPSTSGPFLDKSKSIKIPFKEIFNGLDEPVKTGDCIIVYWWTEALEDFNDVHSEVIIL